MKNFMKIQDMKTVITVSPLCRKAVCQLQIALQAAKVGCQSRCFEYQYKNNGTHFKVQ